MEPMDWPAPTGPPAGAAACVLCGASLPDPEGRCPLCGMHQVRVLPRATKWRIAAGLAAIYAVVAVLLALTR